MQIAVYPYKAIPSGRYTKWIISIAANEDIIVDRYYRGKRQSRFVFSNQNEIKWAGIPKNIKQVALWAKYESKSLVSFQEIVDIEKNSNKWF